MSLRGLIIGGYLTLAVTITLVLWSAVAMVFIDEYTVFEKHEAFRQTDRIGESVMHNLDTLAATSRDWAWWDETYSFMKDADPGARSGYISDNLQPYSMENIRADVIVFLDQNGTISHDVYSPRVGNLEKNSLKAHLVNDAAIIRKKLDQADSITGMIGTSGMPLMIAGSTILPSNLEGEPAGILILGQVMDSGYADSLSGVTSGAVRISWGTTREEASCSENSDQYSGCISEIDTDTLLGSVYFPVILGRGYICISTPIPREIMAHGMNTLISLFMVFLLTTLISGIGIMFIIDRSALNRLYHLIHVVRLQHRNLGADPENLRIPGNDEISELSHAFSDLAKKYRGATSTAQENEIRYRNLAELLPIPVFETDEHGVILVMNSEMMNRFGCDPASGSSECHISDLFAPPGIPEGITDGNAIPRHGYEVRMKDRTGSEYEALLYLSPKTDGEQTTGWRGAIVDITAQKEIQQNLLVSRDRLNLALNGARIAMWDMDLRTGETWVNDQFYTMLEMSDQDIGIPRFETGIHLEDLVQASTLIHECRTGVREWFQEEFRRVTRSGRVIWTLNSGKITRYDTYGCPERVTGIVMDMSDNHQLRDALILTNRKLALLSSMTRHDIKNSIAGIFLTLEIFEGRIAGNETALRCLDLLKTGVEKVLRQINFTSDYEELGLSPPRWQNVIELLQAAIADLPESRIPIHCLVGDLRIFADPMLRKVFYNLLENALRHGGSRLTRIDVSITRKDGSVDLIFANDGVSIPAFRKEEIFRRGIGESTGLGLFLVREILAGTRITITEEGEEGSGVRFVFHIPGEFVRWGEGGG